MPDSSSRRRFLSAAVIGLAPKTERRIEGGFVNDSHEIGHRLRDHMEDGAPARRIRVPLIIVGGGVAGLSAAWRLAKRGFRDFLLLEMEPEAGGNSRWGSNEITAFPWAAHYVPVPNREAKLTLELFEELGLVRNGQWEERHLCHSPQERLFIHGRWQEGIEPPADADAGEFARRMAEFRASGQFTIPVDVGAKPSPLDRISMRQWLLDQGLKSPYLHWYVDYACRDDYGAGSGATSAWAGIHYFASREHSEKGPLTWPEGNGWIVRSLLERLVSFVRTASPVRRITRTGARWRVLAASEEYICDAVIFCAPTFLAHFLIEGAPPAWGFEYSPWLTANLTLDRLPREKGVAAAWDNVIYGSPSLGYVDATHQSISSHRHRTVWTYYRALAEDAPSVSRRWLMAGDWNYWKSAILSDLERAHPDIRQCVSRIDVMRQGHAMVRPAVGFMFSTDRRRWLRPLDRIFFANSDLSGLSLFEEAQWRGVRGADWALDVLPRG